MEIIDEFGVKSKKKYPIRGNKVIIRPARKGPGGTEYAPTFDKSCILPYVVGWGPFKRLKHKLVLIDGANRCVSFRFTKDEQGNKVAMIDVPVWDRWTEEEFFKANVIKAAGSTIQKVSIPTSVYVLLALIFIMQIIGLLVASGRVRIG